MHPRGFGSVCVACLMYYCPSISKSSTVWNDFAGKRQWKSQRCRVDDIIYFASVKYRHMFPEFIIFQLDEIPVNREEKN